MNGGDGAATSRGGTFSLLRQRRFAAFFFAAAISNGGSWMQTVAVPALLFDLTKQATWLGYSSMAILIPAVVLTPYAGVLSDRVSRRKILIVTQCVQMSTALAMWTLYQSGDLNRWWILGLGFAGGIAAGFQSSAWQSFIPLLVAPHDMIKAVRLNSMQFTLARAIGPGFAGVVMATWGTGAAILINALTYPLVIGALTLSNPRHNSVSSRQQSVRSALISGGRYVWSSPPIRLAIVVAFVAAVCGQSLQHVSAAIASRVFGRPSSDNAGLLTAFGIGSLASAAFQTVVGDRMRRSQMATLSLCLMGASAAMLAMTSAYEVGLAAYLVGGFSHLTLAITLNTLIQGKVPDEMRGRAMSYYLFSVLLGIPVGAYVLGRASDVWTMHTSLWIDVAALTACVAGLTVRGTLRTFDE